MPFVDWRLSSELYLESGNCVAHAVAFTESQMPCLARVERISHLMSMADSLSTARLSCVLYMDMYIEAEGPLRTCLTKGAMLESRGVALPLAPFLVYTSRTSAPKQHFLSSSTSLTCSHPTSLFNHHNTSLYCFQPQHHREHSFHPHHHQSQCSTPASSSSAWWAWCIQSSAPKIMVSIPDGHCLSLKKPQHMPHHRMYC